MTKAPPARDACPKCDAACVDVHGSPRALPEAYGLVRCCPKCHYLFGYRKDATRRELMISELLSATRCTVARVDTRGFLIPFTREELDVIAADEPYKQALIAAHGAVQLIWMG